MALMVTHIPSGYDIHSSPWKIPIVKFGKPSISIRAIQITITLW